MAKAYYYNALGDAKEFDVITDNKDGTLDVGVGTTVVVSKVKVTATPQEGCVTTSAPDKPEKKKPEPK